MQAGMVGPANQQIGQADDLALGRVVDFGQHVVGCLRQAAARVGVPAVGQAGHQRRDGLIGQAVGLAHLAHGRTRLKGGHGADQGDAVSAVGATHVVEHFIPPSAAEIQVDVGWAAPGGVQEALEQQVMGDGIDGGDAQAVGQQRVGHAAARADGDGRGAGEAHQVGHQQKQGRVAIIDHGGDFPIQPGQGGRGRGRAVALGQAGRGSAPQLHGRWRVAGQRGPEQATIGQRLVAGVGHVACRGQQLRPLGVGGGERLRRWPRQRAGRVATVRQRAGVHASHGAIGVDGRQQAQKRALLLVKAVDGLGGDDAQPKPAAEGDDLLGQRPVRAGHEVGADRQAAALAKEAAQLGDVARRCGVVAGAQKALQPAGTAAGQTDQAASVGAQLGQRQPKVAAAFAVGICLEERGQATQRTVAGRPGGQQHEMARNGVGVRRYIARGQGDSGRQANDGPDVGRAAGAGEADRAEEGVAIGQGQLSQTVTRGAGDEIGERRRGSQQRVMRMQVQVGKISRQRACHGRDHRTESGDWQATFEPFGEWR